MSTSITIGSTTIHTDPHGRFSLNDLHREAGAEARHQPSNFLRLDSTKALAAEMHQSSEMRSAPISTVLGGSAPGTYVGRELVYAYAMWISPAFHLRVIRAFDGMATGQAPALTFPMPKTFAEALRLAADQQERLEAQSKELETARPAVAFLDKYVEAKSTQALRTVAKVLGVKEREFIAWLLDGGILFRQSGRLMPTAEYQHSGFFEVKTGEANGHAFAQTRFTPGGVSWIAARWAKWAALTST